MKKDAALVVLVYMLAEHHLYLDAHLYAFVQSRQRKACENLQLVLCTCAQLLKVRSHISWWSEWIPEKDKQLLLLVDESELFSHEEICAASIGFDAHECFGFQ